MPDANDASEQIKLLTDFDRTDNTIALIRNQQELEILRRQADQLEASQLTQRQIETQENAANAAAATQELSVRIINDQLDKFGLTPDQARLSQLSGELPASLIRQFQNELREEASRGSREEGPTDRALALQSAIQQVDQHAQQFNAQVGGTPYTNLLNSDEGRARVDDLISADSFFDQVEKGARTAVAGIPGLAAIGASSLASSEDSLLGRAGQFLGGLAGDVQAGAPTDIGSSATQQQFQNILDRADRGELSTGDAIRQGVSLLGDGDFAADVIGDTLGSTVSGGVIRGGASLAARGLPAVARQAGQNVVESTPEVLRTAAATVPAIGAGLGSGVDENLTPGQARLLLATGVASAGVAGAAGALGGQVAETAIGSAARNAPFVGRFTGGTAGQVTDDLTTLGVGAQARGALGGAARTAAGEAPQEFIEGAGESLGQSALPVTDAQGNTIREGRGALETLGDPQARSQAFTAGAVGAPTGAVLGAGAGGISTAAENRTQNINAREARTDIREAQRAQQAIARDAAQSRALDVNAGIEGAAIADEIAQQRTQSQLGTSPISDNEQAEIRRRDELRAINIDQRRQADIDRNASIDNLRQTQFTSTEPLSQQEIEQLPLRQRTPENLQRSVPYALENLIADSRDVQNTVAPLLSQDREQLELSLRALYRNQLDISPLGATPEAEDSFIATLGIDSLQDLAGSDQQISQQFQDSLVNAFQSAVNSPDSQRISDTAVAQDIDDARQQRQQQRAAVQQVREESLNSANARAAESDAEVADRIRQTAEDLAASRITAEEARVRTLDQLAPLSESSGGTPPSGSTSEPSTTDAPISEVDDIGDAATETTPPAEPNPDLTPDETTEGLNPDALFEITDDGVFLSADGRSRGEGLRSAQSTQFQSLDEGDRNRILESTRGAQARRDIDRILQLTDLAPDEISTFRDAVTYLNKEIADRKKPETPAEGDANSATTFTPNPADPQTATPEFAQFFEGSKVVDESNQPLRLFTGVGDTQELVETTQGQFRTVNDSGVDAGTFFSSDSTIAEIFARESNGSVPGVREATSSVQEVFLNLRNPIELDAGGRNFSNISDRFRGTDSISDLDPNIQRLVDEGVDAGILSSLDIEGTSENIAVLDVDQIKRIATRLGFDGAIVRNVTDRGSVREGGIQDQYIAFDPTQIKSATNNEGSFDSDNPNFRQSRSTPAVTGSVGPARAPLSTGLLPETDLGAQQSQSFTTDTVQDVVNTITSNWKRVPNIQIVATNADLPANLQSQNGSLSVGVTDGDTAYLVADQLESAEHIEATLTEELFHKGLARSLGGNYDPQLARVFRKRGGVQGLLQLGTRYNIPANFTSLYADVIADAQQGNREAQLELTDEVLARVAQSPDLPSGLLADIKTVAARIKRYLRQFFPDEWFDTVTDADLLLMIREANQAGLEDGVGGPVRVRQARSTPGDVFMLNRDGNLTRFNIPNQEFRDASDPRIADAVGHFRTAATQKLDQAPRTAEGFRQGLANLVNRSGFYGGIVKRVSDARDDSRRQEGEFRQMSDQQVDGIFNAVSQLDLPPSIQRLLAPTQGNSTLARQAKEKITAIHSALQRSASRAFDLSTRADRLDVGNGQSFFDRVKVLQEAIVDVANHLGITVEQAKATLGNYAIALHASERNDVMYLRNPPLQGTVVQETHADLRKAMEDATDPAEFEQARTELAEFVQTHSTVSRAEFNGSGMTDAQAQQVIDGMAAVPSQLKVMTTAIDAMRSVQEATNEINRISGQLTNSQQTAFDRLGWQNYVPLRGQGVDVDADIQDARGPYRSDEFNTSVRAAQGRQSLTDNVYDNVINAGTSALMNLSHQESLDSLIFHTVASDTSEYQQAFEADGANGELYKGRVEVVDVNTPGFKQIAGRNDPFTFIRYHSENNGNDVQLATVIRLDNSQGADAIRGARSELADRINQHLQDTTVAGVSLPEVTRFTASLKTYRSIPFIPFSALREMFTNGYVAATDNGLSGMQAYVDTMMQGDFNYLRNLFRYSRLFAANDFNGIRDLVANAEDGSTLRQLDEFFSLGGPTQYLAALRETPPGSVESLTKLGDVSTFRSAAQKADEFFSYANGAFDLMSRFAYYRSLVDNGTEPSVAAARAKGIANFEQSGTWGGPLGAVFEFARPSASGATGLINATLTGRYGPETAAASFAAGSMLYLVMTMLAGQDEDEIDYMAEVNGKLLVRNVVFQWGDDPSERIQFGTGFGPMAGILASGMQSMRFLLGHQSLEDLANNTTSAIANQFQVLPTAGISPLEKPLDFIGNTLTPSILKPWYEVERNLSGLGIPVRNAGFGDQVADSFGARYNSEQELYDQMTQHLSNTFGVEFNPDNVRHLMRGYGGTITQVIESAFEGFHAATSDGDFILNKKHAYYPLRAFFAPTLGQTQDDFYRHFNRVDEIDERIKELRARNLPGDEEQALALEESDGFAENLANYRTADRSLQALNDEFRTPFRDGTTSVEEIRRLKQDRNQRLRTIQRDYLDQIVR